MHSFRSSEENLTRKPSPETVAKIRQYIEWVRTEPRRFDMTYWGVTIKDEAKPQLKTGEPMYGISNSINGKFEIHAPTCGDKTVAQLLEEQDPPCGTVCCMAGGICMMAGFVKPQFEKGCAVYSFPADTGSMAERWLGISWRQAHRLFQATNWPEKFRKQYNKADNAHDCPGKVEALIDRLEYFIETGE